MEEEEEEEEEGEREGGMERQRMAEAAPGSRI